MRGEKSDRRSRCQNHYFYNQLCKKKSGWNQATWWVWLRHPKWKIGEYWVISAHPNGVSKVANGRYEGTDLATLYAEHRELFGNRPEPVFPLLTKILDANDWLSVQVHPDDAYGLEHEGELGKTECWYIIAADEGSEIIYGHNAKSKEELRQQIEDKNWDDCWQKYQLRLEISSMYKWHHARHWGRYINPWNPAV